MASTNTGITDRLTRLLSSIKLAVVLLILMAVVSMFGTVVPQDQEAAVYVARYGEKGFGYLKALGLIDLYHSLGFRLLTALLTLNIIVCTYQRLKGVIRRTLRPTVERAPESIASLKIHNMLPEPDKLYVLERVLRDKRYIVLRSGSSVYAAKGRAGAWGDMLSHASIILIIVGAIIGSFGHTSTVNIYEDGYVDEVYNWSAGRDVRPGFRFFVDRVSVQHYPARLKVAVRGRSKGEDLGVYEAVEGREFAVPGTEYTIMPEELDTGTGQSTFRVFKAGRLRGLYDTAYPDGGPLAPIAFEMIIIVNGYERPAIKSLAATVRFDREGYLIGQGVISVNHPMVVREYKIFLTAINTDSSGRNYVGFQMTYDPGVWFVWAGFGLLLLGLTVSFSVSFRRIWIYAGEDSIVVGGLSNRDVHGFMREYVGMLKSYVQESGE